MFFLSPVPDLLVNAVVLVGLAVKFPVPPYTSLGNPHINFHVLLVNAVGSV